MEVWARVGQKLRKQTGKISTSTIISVFFRRFSRCLMRPCIPAKGVSSFIAFYSCSRPVQRSGTSSLSFYRSRCLHNLPNSAHRLPLPEAYLRERVRSVHRSLLTVLTTRSDIFMLPQHQPPPKDPYSVLGVNKDATAAEIKKVYFSVRPLSRLVHSPCSQYVQLARKYHPDTNPRRECTGQVCRNSRSL